MEVDPVKVAKSPRKKRRAVLIGAVVLLVLLALFAFFLPYLLKRYIEKHSVEWIGRTITIDNIILNPFTFTYAVNGVACHEPGSDAVFVSWKSISVKSDLWRGFREKDWRFRQLRIEDPYFHIVQHGDRFNFSDLLELGGPDTATATTDAAPVHFRMEDVRIGGGRIAYDSDLLKAPLGISGLHAECTLITADQERMDFTLGLTLDSGGTLDAGFMIDLINSRYAIDADLRAFALPQLLPYLQDFMHTTALKGTVDVALHLQDGWADPQALAASGTLAMDHVEVTDAAGEALVGLEKLRVHLDTLNAKSSSFKLQSIAVDRFTTRFEQWADGSNTWTKVLKLDSSTTADSADLHLAAAPGNVFVMLADYITLLGRDFVANQYTADSMVLANSAVEFADFTPEKPFRYSISEIGIRSSRISTTTGTADFSASARLNGRGRLTSTFRFDPKDFRNVDAEMQVHELGLADLDAYSRWYGAYPLQAGLLDYTGRTTIQGGRIDSQNGLVVHDLRFGKKVAVHDTGIFILPLRLAASLLKDVHGVIKLDVPVKGDLSDPTFKVWPIVWQVLKNLVVKAAAAPVRLVAGVLGAGADAETEEVRFASLQVVIGKDQRRALDGLAALLKAKPDINVALVPITDPQQEQEEWAAFRVKRNYLAQAAAPAEKDSVQAMALSLRDPAFLAYLDGLSPGTKGAPERERCISVLGPAAVKQAVEQEEQLRRDAVMAYLLKAGCDAKRMAYRSGTKEEITGHLGAPGYRYVFDAE